MLGINIFLVTIVEHNQFGERDFIVKPVAFMIYVKLVSMKIYKDLKIRKCTQLIMFSMYSKFLFLEMVLLFTNTNVFHAIKIQS